MCDIEALLWAHSISFAAPNSLEKRRLTVEGFRQSRKRRDQRFLGPAYALDLGS